MPWVYVYSAMIGNLFDVVVFQDIYAQLEKGSGVSSRPLGICAFFYM